MKQKDISKKSKEKKKKSLISKRFFGDLFLVGLIVFLIFVAMEHFKGGREEVDPVVLGEGDQEIQRMESEKFRSPLISFGGNSAMPDELREKPLKVFDVKSELLATKDQEEIKLAVSWKTSKPAISEIQYGRNASSSKKRAKENRYDFDHSLILSSLDPATAYVYEIISKDKWGNEEKSDKFAFYTGAPNVSLIDLLLEAFGDVFGWATN